MERGCAEECGEESVVNYDRETKTSICCQTDGYIYFNLRISFSILNFFYFKF